MKSILNIEFLPGTDISEAIDEARTLAVKLNFAYVRFIFSGITIVVGKRANIDNGVAMYREACRSTDGSNNYLIIN